MFRRIQNLALSSLAIMLFMAAGSGVGVRCVWQFHEPDIPECLQR